MADLTTEQNEKFHGVFIAVEAEESVASDPELATKLTEVCPVDIYATNDDGTLRVVEGNLDECVLCELCVQAAPPGGIRVRKLYDGSELSR